MFFAAWYWPPLNGSVSVCSLLFKINRTCFYSHITVRYCLVSIADGFLGAGPVPEAQWLTGLLLGLRMLQGLGSVWDWCCRMPSATSAGSCGATAPSSATAPGCVCNSTLRDSQRSRGMSFTPKIKRFQGCSIHKNTFFLRLWTVLQNVFTSYCQIFSIFLISRTPGENFQTNK